MPLEPRSNARRADDQRSATVHRRRTDDGHCGFCLQSYAYEFEVFCAHCDRPMCVVCVVTQGFRGERLCPECANGNPSEED